VVAVLSLCGVAFAQVTVIEDFSGGVNATNHPTTPQYGVWYDAHDDTFGTPSANTLEGSPAMRIDDGGFVNGVYIIYQSAVPATDQYVLTAKVHVIEDAAVPNGVRAYQLGAAVGAAAQHRVDAPAAALPGVANAGNYAGLTSGLDATTTQIVTTNPFAATAGDDLLVALATDVVSGAWNGDSGAWGTAPNICYILVDDIELVVQPAIDGQIVINEFAYDDSSTDDLEFVELYNAGSVSVDISGWTLKGGDLNVDNTVAIAGGAVIAPGGYYVVGHAAVPNVDQVMSVSFQNDQDWIQLADASGAQKDFVTYETWNQGPGNPPAPDGTTTITMEGVGIWGTFAMIEAGSINQGADPSFASFTWARFPNGADTDNNADDFTVAVASPGEANGTYGTVTIPYTNNFDDADGSYYFDLAGSFVSTSAQDPLTADVVGAGSVNPVAIAASPQGGNVGVMWDASGGGDAAIVNLSAPVADLSIECYVYIDAKAQAAGEYESTTWFCVRGHGDHAYYNTPNLGFGANFNEGIYVVYSNANAVNTITKTTVELVEKHEGVETVIGSIPITAGVNDGWQRLYLNANGADVALLLGGTYGDVNTGALVRTTSATITKAGGIGMGYRENIGTDQTARPWTVDALAIDVADTLPPNLSVDDWSLF